MGDLYWLLDLEFAGQILRLSTADLVVPSTELGDLLYTGAMQEFTFSEALELLDSQLTQANVQVTAVLPVNVPALVAHLEKMQARKRITRVRKLAVKKSTIWKRQHWVAQLFLAVMAILRSVFAEEHRLLILPKKSVQIPQL